MTTTTTYIALLRAVNLPRHKQIAMADLRALLEALGFSDAQTLLQSGNLVFRGKPRRTAAVEALLEAEASKRLGLETDFFVRTAAEWKEILGRNPFPREAGRDPGHLLLLVLKGEVDAQHVGNLQKAIKGRETVRGEGREVWAFYPDGVGRSKLTNKVIESKLETRTTGRNWNTAVKLLEAAR